MLRRWFVATLILPALIAAGCGEKIGPGTTSQGGKQTVRADTAVARFAPAPLVYEAVGTVRARQIATLAARTMGTVTAVNAEEGRYVTRDAVLVSLVRRQLDAGLAEARAALEAAVQSRSGAEASRQQVAAQEKLARATYARYRQLLVGESASAQEMDEVRTRLEAARAGLARAEAGLAAAEKQVARARAGLAAAAANRADTQLKAPFDALVTGRMVEPGDLVAPGRPLLTLEAREGYRVEMVLPADHASKVNAGQRLSVVLTALGGRRIEAPVESILPDADAATRSVTVRLALPEIEGVRSGLFARVRVPVGESAALCVPAAALVHEGQLTGLYTVGEDGTARYRLVRTGRVQDDRVEILSGLADGERYVTVPVPGLCDGCRVEAAS